ncbi:DUF2177 family protein [Rhizobium sp. CF122]|uniref:DUF2177 family protein n=1 Tax=Rhizobium sp. CF122 TaxID=1144312 RepID=UPI0009D947F7|nr:DUF2177 family protein [Rhizobium sp. CF122]
MTFRDNCGAWRTNCDSVRKGNKVRRNQLDEDCSARLRGLFHQPTGSGRYIAGAVLGAAACETYGLTNHATLRNWPVAMTIMDLRGTFLTALSAAAGLLTARIFG